MRAHIGRTRLGFLLLLVISAFMLSVTHHPATAADGQLVLASSGSSDYQVVIPDESGSREIAQWLKKSAQLISDAFEANGFDLAVVTESTKDASKPGIYLGKTELSKKEGVEAYLSVPWSYTMKVVGEDLVITGSDQEVPDSLDESLRVSLGTVKGICDFLREYAGTRFLYPGETGIEFLPVDKIAVPADLNMTKVPLVKYNYCLGWKTGLYEIANNMFPPPDLPKKYVKTISDKDADLFDNKKDYKLLDENVAYTYNWGTFHALGYTPKSTPRVVGAVMKRLVKDDITGIVKDGFGECFGLEGAVYYIHGRVLDTPDKIHADLVYSLLQEYCAAAFGEASAPMQRFVDNLLYEGLELYAEWMDVGAPAEYFIDDDGNRQRYMSDPLHYLSYIYSANLLTDLEAELEQAKSLAVSDKVKKRLELVEMEFDYLKSMMTVIHLYNSHKIMPDDASMNSLLDAIDEWNTLVDSYYGPDGRIKTLSGWPELVPFGGDPRPKVGLTRDEYLAKFSDTPFSWDTEAKRK